MSSISKKTAKKNMPVVLSPDNGESTLLTPKLISEVEKLYLLGLKDSAIANMVGIRPVLLLEWLTKGATFNIGLHGELFRRCAKALGTAQFQWIAEIRKHGLGAAAEYAYDTVTAPDGTITKTLSKDGKGRPILLKKEVPANVDHLKWLLEKRFPKAFGKQLEVDIESLIDIADNNASFNKDASNNEGSRDGSEIIISEILNEEEQIKLLEIALRSKKVKYDQES